MDIKKIFDEVSNKMISDLEMVRATLNHPGIKGNSAEDSFREFLKNYLPKNLDVSTGIIVDANNNSSKQLDVIISDSIKTPIFYEKNGSRVIPVECVYSVIEVKTTLNKKELNNAFENMKSVRMLKKSAFFEQTSPITYVHKLYGKEWENLWPINYFIFAYDSIDPGKLLKEIESKHKKEKCPLHSRIDTVCILNAGVISNMSHKVEGQIDGLPDDDSELVYVDSDIPLLLFYTLITRYLNQSKMIPDFDFTKYLSNIKNFGNVHRLK
jgi:hypothetical protein